MSNYLFCDLGPNLISKLLVVIFIDELMDNLG